MKALVGAFNQEKALVGAFSVIVKPVVEPMDHFTALLHCFTIINNRNFVLMIGRQNGGGNFAFIQLIVVKTNNIIPILSDTWSMVPQC